MSAPNIPNWARLDAEQRANAVLDWCLEQGINTSSILGYQLAAAMAEQTKTIEEDCDFHLEASPGDYVSLIRVLAAFLRSRL